MAAARGHEAVPESEQPVDDVREQNWPDESGTAVPDGEVPVEVDEADLADQLVEVDLDDVE
ncbi:hypothetical protein CFN78_17550 [Amycolatopsis antarctica]|uniref:Uncharacterized protein n=1 Tax=Amycolatopsis antarctica TaxID=1854586 RepID=A0A263D166_9PSEU|nr:hypothetical protein [Amycolatopsis antarctica]OZM71949.1 hypothetical protein CFN78_17550 [Amycolatopsis antarctica]